MDIKYICWKGPLWGKAYIWDEEWLLELLNLLGEVLISWSWLIILLRDLWKLLVGIWELGGRFEDWEMGEEMEGWDMEDTVGGGVPGVEMCCLDELPLYMWEMPLFAVGGTPYYQNLEIRKQEEEREEDGCVWRPRVAEKL